MISKLLCKLGFHRWRYNGKFLWWNKQQCAACGATRVPPDEEEDWEC